MIKAKAVDVIHSHFPSVVQLLGTGALPGAARGRLPRHDLLVDIQPRLLVHPLQPVRVVTKLQMELDAIWEHVHSDQPQLSALPEIVFLDPIYMFIDRHCPR